MHASFRTAGTVRIRPARTNATNSVLCRGGNRNGGGEGGGGGGGEKIYEFQIQIFRFSDFQICDFRFFLSKHIFGKICWYDSEE